MPDKNTPPESKWIILSDKRECRRGLRLPSQKARANPLALSLL